MRGLDADRFEATLTFGLDLQWVGRFASGAYDPMMPIPYPATGGI